MKYFLLTIFVIVSAKNHAQENMIKKFFNLHSPEQWWIITHPFSAKKAYQITNQVLQITNKIINDSTLDGDNCGGQVDAFRHGLWMALLSQKLSAQKARTLGIAHEKSNRIDFEKKLLEENHLPDSIASAMDLKNNEIGIEIGLLNKHATIEELIEIVKKYIFDGCFWVINKNKNGVFLDWENKPIDMAKYKGKWYNPKILVPSNCSRK